MRPPTWANTDAFRAHVRIKTPPRLIIRGSHRPRKRILKRPKKNKLPRFEYYIVMSRNGSMAVSGVYAEHFNKLVKDLSRLWYGEVRSNPSQSDRTRQEIASTVLLFIALQWKKYKKGLIDRFPPYPGYVYVAAKGLMMDQFGKPEDVLGMFKVEHFNTIEGGYEMQSGLFTYVGSSPNDKHLSRFVNPDEFDSKKKYYKKDEEPDMIDLWNLELDIVEMGMIFGMTLQQVRKRLHGLYDAMKKSTCKAKPERERPYKRPHNP